MILFDSERILNLVLYVDDFILDTAQQNPAIIAVNETDDVVLKCRINQQENLEGLSIRWQRFSVDVKQEDAKSVSKRGGAFDLELMSARQKDAGVYQCVIVSQIGDTVIDSGSDVTLVVNCKFGEHGVSSYVYILFLDSPSVEILAEVINSSIKPKGRELEIPYHGNVDLVCKATGLPLPDIVMLRNNRDLSLKQEDYTVTLEIRDATDKNDGHYCCRASNMLGSTPEYGACLSVDVQSKTP